MKKIEAKILDTTARWGSFIVHNHVLPEQMGDLARELERAGIRYMEISHSRGIGGKKAGYPGLFNDRDLLEAARKAAPNLHFSVYLATYPYSLFEIEPLAELFAMGRVGINPDEIETGIEYLRRLKEFGKTAFAILMRIHLKSPEEIATCAESLAAAGADGVYLSDTFGSMDAGETTRYVEAVRKKTKIPIGFQAMNYSGRGIHNTLAALQAGVEWVDASLLGVGPGGGTVPLEVLVGLLKREGKAKEINVEELCHAARWQTLPTFRKIPHNDYPHLLFSKHRIDFDPALILQKMAEVLEIGLEELLLELKQQFPGLIQVKEAHLREYLAHEHIDFDIFLNFLKTGMVPGIETG